MKLLTTLTLVAAVACTSPSADVGGARAYHHPEYPEARWIPAREGHYDVGRGGDAITHIIIHTMQGSYESAISWFRDPANPWQTSAHYNIRSSDGEITQMVHEADAAHHIGGWNSFTIGIEHEGWMEDPDRWYTDAMYESSARLVRHICDKYDIPIDREHILGHGEVPGGITDDPGPGWDWGRYMRLIREAGPAVPPDAGAVDAGPPDSSMELDAGAASAEAGARVDTGTMPEPDSSIGRDAGRRTVAPDPGCGCAAPGASGGRAGGPLLTFLVLALCAVRRRRRLQG